MSQTLADPSAAPGGPHRPAVIVVVLIGVTTALRIWAGAALGLGNGEAYYASCAIRPALSYFDQPPLALWMGYLGVQIAGGLGPLALRMPFILMFAGTTWLLFILGRRLFSPAAGMWAAVLLNLAPVFTFTTAIWLQVDGPLMFFWLASVWCMVRIFLDADLKRPLVWWAALGGCMGLALLSKYVGVFLIAGAGMFMLTRRGQLRWLLTPGPYLALAIVAAVFSPVLVWNARYDWISFRFQGGRGLESAGIRLDWLGRNLIGQSLWLLPWLWAPLLWMLGRCFIRGGRGRRGRSRRADGYWLMAWLAVLPIVAFNAVAAYAPIGLHFHWAMPGYLLLLLPLGEAVTVGLAARPKLTRRWLVASAVFTVIVVTVIVTHTVTGWWRTYGPAYWAAKFGQETDPTLEALDWSDLPDALASPKLKLLGRPDTFVFTHRWFQSGKAEYALRGRMPVLCLHPRDVRSYGFFHRQEDYVGQDAVFIAPADDKPDKSAWYRDYFQSIEPIGEVHVRRAGRIEQTLRLYFCKNFRGGYPLPYP